MHLRKLVLACGFASFALSNFASALGLGEVKLNSTLNEPLNAEIKLLDVRDLSADQIIVGLASPADFERNGVDRLYFYTSFQFEVVLSSPNGAFVRVTTSGPVREPYLNFLLDARWTSGRLLREYTVLMDLPTFEESTPQAINVPQTSAPVTAVPEETAPVDEPVVEDLPEPEVLPEPSVTAPEATASEETPTEEATEETAEEESASEETATEEPVAEETESSEEEAPAETESEESEESTEEATEESEEATEAETETTDETEATEESTEESAEESPADEEVTDEETASEEESTEESTEEVTDEETASEEETTEEESTEEVADENADTTEQAPTEKKSKLESGAYGPVDEKETLWEIAQEVRPDSSHSIPQTMLALQRLNPKAFIRDNINLLKKGQVLRVPESEEIKSVSKSQAFEQFKSQNSEWTSAVTGASDLGAQLDASPNVASTRTESEPVSGRVKLEAPGSDVKGDGGQGSGANKGAGKALESELASTLEELDKSKSENTELSSRVNDLDDQAKTMQKLVDVSNEKLRALQLNSAKQAEAEKQAEATRVAEQAREAEKALAAEKAAIPDLSADSQEKIADITPPPAPVAETAAAVSSAAVVAVAKKKIAVVPEKIVATEKSIVEHILENIIWIALGLGVLGAGAFFVIRRRNQADMDSDFIGDDNDFTSEPNFDSFAESPQEEAPEYEPEPEPEEAPEEYQEDTTAIAETGDVVGEADIYIAYGKYDQAEEMLLNGLAKEPHSGDIRLKLLEVYSHTQNASAFDHHFSALLPNASNAVKNRALELRANIAGADEFADTTLVAPSKSGAHKPAKVEEEDDFSFDLSLDDEPKSIKLNEPAANKSYESDFGSSFNDNKKSVSLEDKDDDFALDFDTNDISSKFEEAEDLSDISNALDGLDDALVKDGDDPDEFDEDISFDFEALESDPTPQKTAKGSSDDDFNFEMDVDDVDLAALDHEMEGFDADLDMLDADLDLDTDDVPAPAPAPSRSAKNIVPDEDVFNEALSDFSAESLQLEAANEMSQGDMDNELDFMADADEAATKLDLARAYIDMGDNDGARDILAEVAHEGNEQQRREASELLTRIDV